MLGRTKAERLKTKNEWKEWLEKRKIEVEAEELGLQKK